MARLTAIEAEMDVPEIVELPRRRKKVAVDARVTLRNIGEEDLVVHARSSDDRHFWQVFDSNHREVLREKRNSPGRAKTTQEDGVHSVRTATVAGGQEVHASRRLELDAAKLRAGEVYTVRAEFFAHVAEARFAVIGRPSAVRRKPGKKKPAKGKTARKKGGGKKAARKKTGK